MLFALGILLFPWKLICFAHPFGHSKIHHEPGKLSPCELRKNYKGNGPAYFPEMHCHKLSTDSADYLTQENLPVKPTQQTLAITVVLFEVVKINSSNSTYLFPPEPKCRSATIISVHTLRGPPLV